MSSTRNTKFLQKNDLVTIARKYRRFRKLKSTIRPSNQKGICGHIVRLPDDNFIGQIYVDKDFNLVREDQKPNIELRFKAIKKRGTMKTYTCISALDWASPNYVKIIRT